MLSRAEISSFPIRYDVASAQDFERYYDAGLGICRQPQGDGDDAPPPPPAGEGSSRGARVKEEKADDGGDDGDFSAFSKFFY